MEEHSPRAKSVTLSATRSRGFDSELVRGAKAALPVLLGFIPFALVLGAQASHKGLSAYEVALMTGLNFGGGSEFRRYRTLVIATSGDSGDDAAGQQPALADGSGASPLPPAFTIEKSTAFSVLHV